MTQLSEVGGDERVGGGDGSVGDAGVHCAELDHGVLQVIAGEHGNRAIEGERTVEKRLRDVTGFGAGLRVSFGAPGADVVTLGEEDSIGGVRGPMIEAVGETGGIRAEDVAWIARTSIRRRRE